jgi:hypothetical protein
LILKNNKLLGKDFDDKGKRKIDEACVRSGCLIRHRLWSKAIVNICAIQESKRSMIEVGQGRGEGIEKT